MTDMNNKFMNDNDEHRDNDPKERMSMESEAPVLHLWVRGTVMQIMMERVCD